MSNNKWLESLPADERIAYLAKVNEKKRARYATDAEYRERIKSPRKYRHREKYVEKRKKALDYLGDRCSNSFCNWINTDGTRGCTDERCLQVDHVKGDGAKLRSDGLDQGHKVYDNVLLTIPGEVYQLLCANCNWIKRHENKEVPQPRCIENTYVFVDQRKLREKDELGRFVAVAGA